MRKVQPGSRGRPSPPRRDRERHPGSQVRRGAQPSPFGTLPSQRRLAGRPGHRSQPCSLDNAHRLGRAIGDHQDTATTLFLPGRTHHPQGPPHLSASATGLALAEPVRPRSRQTARPAPPILTPFTASDPSTGLPNRLADLRQAGPLTQGNRIINVLQRFQGRPERRKPLGEANQDDVEQFGRWNPTNVGIMEVQ